VRRGRLGEAHATGSGYLGEPSGDADLAAQGMYVRYLLFRLSLTFFGWMEKSGQSKVIFVPMQLQSNNPGQLAAGTVGPSDHGEGSLSLCVQFTYPCIHVRGV
jgi:hypothetical protein